MERKLSVAGRVHQVVAQAAEAGALRVRVDGAVTEVRVLASDGARHLVEAGQELRELFTVRDGDATWVWCRGRALRVEPVRPARARSAALAGPEASAPRDPVSDGARLPEGAVAAPTSSVVVAVLVGEGEAVQAGQGLVVVSAMKTETRLVSAIAGKVAAVSARPGTAVRAGEVLVQVTAEAGGEAPTGRGARDGG